MGDTMGSLAGRPQCSFPSSKIVSSWYGGIRTGDLCLRHERGGRRSVQGYLSLIADLTAERRVS
jgi:hypothetical protein